MKNVSPLLTPYQFFIKIVQSNAGLHKFSFTFNPSKDSIYYASVSKYVHRPRIWNREMKWPHAPTFCIHGQYKYMIDHYSFYLCPNYPQIQLVGLPQVKFPITPFHNNNIILHQGGIRYYNSIVDPFGFRYEA